DNAEANSDETLKDNAEMVDTMDNEDEKFCLDDMSIGFEEDHLNGEIKVTLYQDDHIPLDEIMDVNVKDTLVVTDSSPVVETIVIESTFMSKKVNLDQCITDVMDAENNTVGLDTPFNNQQPTTPRPEKRRTITSQLLQLQLNDDSDVADEELENIDSREYTIKEILPFCEDLRRHKKSNLYKVTMPCYIKSLMKKVKDGHSTPLFKLVWDPYGIVVDLQFWLAFLGFEEKKEGGSPTVYRTPNADWAIAGPHFCPTIIGEGMPVYVSNAKNGCVPWIEVEKVYFPLNKLDTHWALAELHLRTGLITVYDSMSPRKRNKAAPIVENRNWWLNMRKSMSQQLPLFLDKISVLKRKGLVVGDYKITYKFEEKVPHQGSVYGDCGVWESSFMEFPYYFHNLKLANEGTVTHIDTDDQGCFNMCFLAFGVAIRSFKSYMRPLIKIDGAHLKGTYLGTNLLVVGMDANNLIIPLATGVSQGETIETWSWFLTKLKECIGEDPNLVIISDRHYSITVTCANVFPNAFHGCCCRHLMMNCKFKSDKLKAWYWKTCKAYTVPEFKRSISGIKALRPEA
ncbi:transposase, MuDR, MULE transposase domain protein, partial [Tanacetum coccineum]